METRSTASILCLAAVDRLGAELLLLDLSGRIVHANTKARDLFPLDSKEAEVDVRFDQLWTEPAATITPILRQIAGSSAWQPFSLTRAGGSQKGLRTPLNGCGLAVDDGGVQKHFILIASDPARYVQFAEHTRLIARLNAELASGQRAEMRLDDLLQQQQRLHRELVHRVKNNLSLLISLLEVSRRQTKDPSSMQLFHDLERRIMSVAAVHELLDKANETDFVQADQLIARICEELQRALAKDSIKIDWDLTPIRLHIEDATPLALIVNELVTNALKHAFPSERGTGRILIGLKRNGVDKLEATIHDDGVGLSEGTSTREGTGTQIIAALSRQLRGQLSRSAEGGTKWQLIFPPRRPEAADVIPA